LDSHTKLPIIEGVSTSKLLSLKDATKSLKLIIPNIEKLVEDAKNPFINKTKSIGDLNLDEAASIYLYTMNSPVYKLMNEALFKSKSTERNTNLEPFFLYLKLLLTAKDKLTTYKKSTIFRGFKFKTKKEKDTVLELYKKLYSKNEPENRRALVWWNASSCTESIETLENNAFLGKNGFRIRFIINAQPEKYLSGKDIQNYSHFGSKEAEILLSPGCIFEIKGISDSGNDLHDIHLEEINPAKLLVPFK